MGQSFRIGPHGTREEVIAKYAVYLAGNDRLLRDLSELKGKRLGCFCAPKLCHGDVLALKADML